MKKIWVGAIAISVAAILWGIDGVILTPRLYNLNVPLVIFMLHALPFLLMQLFFFKQYALIRKFTVSDFLWFGLIALFGGAIGTMAIVKSLFLVQFNHLSVVVLLQKLQPVFAIILSSIILKERVTGRFLILSVCAIVGGYIMTFGLNLPESSASGNLLAASILAVLAAFSFGSSTVFSKKILGRYNHKTVTFYRYGFTSFFMFIYLLFNAENITINAVTTENWITFLIIALTTGSGAIFLYYFGLQKIKAHISAILELFFPLTVILFDMLVNDSYLRPQQWLGAGLLVMAVVSINYLHSRSMLRK